MSAVHLPVAARAPSVHEAVAEDLRRRVRALNRAARRVRRRRDDEAVHDLRVASRRVEAALATWKPLLRSGPRRRASARIRKLRRRLGPAREREVVLGRLRAELGAAPTGDPMAIVLDRLALRVRRARRRAARRASKARVRRSADLVERSLTTAAIPAPRDAQALERARRRAAELLALARIRIATALDHPAEEPLHQARLAVKRWRYAQECVGSVGAQDGGDLAAAAEMQDVLGEINDDLLLTRYLAREAVREERRGRRDVVARLERLREQADGLRPARIRELDARARRGRWLAAS